MEEEKKEKLVIEGNSVYEIDMECWNQRFGKKERTGTEKDGQKEGGKP
ncbi:MAG: hypothetical protein ACOYBE_12585 [Blautia sp.]|jgi:hypothetical protein